MWVYLDLIKDESQWTIVSNRKSKGKARVKPCNVVSISLKEEDSDLAPLANIEVENNILTAQIRA